MRLLPLPFLFLFSSSLCSLTFAQHIDKAGTPPPEPCGDDETLIYYNDYYHEIINPYDAVLTWSGTDEDEDNPAGVKTLTFFENPDDALTLLGPWCLQDLTATWELSGLPVMTSMSYSMDWIAKGTWDGSSENVSGDIIWGEKVYMNRSLHSDDELQPWFTLDISNYDNLANAPFCFPENYPCSTPQSLIPRENRQYYEHVYFDDDTTTNNTYWHESMTRLRFVDTIDDALTNRLAFSFAGSDTIENCPNEVLGTTAVQICGIIYTPPVDESLFPVIPVSIGAALLLSALAAVLFMRDSSPSSSSSSSSSSSPGATQDFQDLHTPPKTARMIAPSSSPSSSLPHSASPHSHSGGSGSRSKNRRRRSPTKQRRGSKGRKARPTNDGPDTFTTTPIRAMVDAQERAVYDDMKTVTSSQAPNLDF